MTVYNWIQLDFGWVKLLWYLSDLSPPMQICISITLRPLTSSLHYQWPVILKFSLFHSTVSSTPPEGGGTLLFAIGWPAVGYQRLWDTVWSSLAGPLNSSGTELLPVKPKEPNRHAAPINSLLMYWNVMQHVEVIDECNQGGDRWLIIWWHLLVVF